MPIPARKQFRRLHKISAAILAAWTVLVAVSLAWNIHVERQRGRELATKEALSHFNMDMAFNFWGISHGGAYIPIDERTPPNPNLAHIPERDITTPSGIKLTLMNPASMVRQIMDEYAKLYGVKGKITSFPGKLFNPINAPDDWELAALKAFERGEEEALEFTEIDGQPFLRLMHPLFIQKPCLKCHAVQGYKVGDLRGGVGVYVPMTAYLTAEEKQVNIMIVSHGVIWLLGLGSILAVARRSKIRTTERLLAEEALQRSHESLTAIMDSMDSLVYIADMSTYEVLFFNKYGKNVFGDITGKACWKSIQAGQSGPCSFCTNDKLLSADGKPTGVYVWEFQNTVNGHWYECRDQAIKWIDGHIVRMENATDITERKLAEEKIKHMAQYDMLTNLPNRALCIDRLSVALSVAKRKENRVAFLFVDLDDFKPVNDKLGHEAGDRVLKEVAGRLSSCVREMDTVARFGGDEFTVVLTDITSKSSVTGLAEKILESLSKPYQLDGEKASLSCSIGIALFPEHGQTPDELIKYADDAMYVVKKEGKRDIRYASRQK